MTKANKARGELSIELEGVSYEMRPSWEAIEAFETETGLALEELADRAQRGALKLAAAATIVTECVKAWGRASGNRSATGFKAENVKPLLVEAGLLIVSKRIALMLFMAVTGGLTSSGEAKAIPETTETTTATADDPGSAESPVQP